jgi:hypothetical protein
MGIDSRTITEAFPDLLYLHDLGVYQVEEDRRHDEIVLRNEESPSAT